FHTSKEPLDATLDGIQVWNAERNKLIRFKSGVHSPKDALINGEPINNMKYYSIALPSEIHLALNKTLLGLKDAILANAKEVPNSHFWPLMEDYIRKNSPIRCLED